MRGALNMSYEELFTECQSRAATIRLLNHELSILQRKNRAHNKKQKRLTALVVSENGQRDRANKLKVNLTKVKKDLAEVQANLSLAIQKYNELAASSR